MMQRRDVKPNESAQVDSAEAFAKPARERPGLATSWGKPVKAPMGDLRFTRATSKPVGVDAIFTITAKDWRPWGGCK
jgi:hypothetical protein